MFKLITKIVSDLIILFILFCKMFSSWYSHAFHHDEYISSDDSSFDETKWRYSFSDEEEDLLSSSERNYFSDEDYISDTGSDYDMHDFESYYYEYVS